jgi:hypothetical protein
MILAADSEFTSFNPGRGKTKGIKEKVRPTFVLEKRRVYLM